MKELSIEEKAKAYDKAYEKVAVRFGSNVADGIFIEESEDEKIRKELIDFIYDKTDTYELREKSNSWLAWLEKQCKKESDPRYKYLEELLTADDIFQMAMNDEMIEEAKEKATKALSNMSIGDLLGIKKQGEQNPTENTAEWSEEDKKMFVNIKACLRNANKDYSREVDWLKSIKPQPKNEWSEEDEKRIKKVIHILSLDGRISNKELESILKAQISQTSETVEAK